MKFRVFDKKLKERMIYLDQHEEMKLVFYSDGTWVILDESGTIITSNGGHGGKLMMGIDFKDKNGKEIYEGDIVVCREMRDSNIYDAWVDVDGIVVPKKFVVGRDKLPSDLQEHPERWEVIGNIYENPELLR